MWGRKKYVMTPSKPFIYRIGSNGVIAFNFWVKKGYQLYVDTSFLY